MTLRYFDDLIEGEELFCQPVAFSREAILAFGGEFDPLPFHTNEATAQQSLFGGLIASSLHTLSACTKAVVQAQGRMAILCGVAVHEALLTNPVRPGDVLAVKAWWADLRRSRSKPDRGFASIRCEVFNQTGEPVMTHGYRYMIACRSFAVDRVQFPEPS